MKKCFRFVLRFLVVTGFFLISQMAVDSAYAETYTFTFKNINHPKISSVFAELRSVSGGGYAPMGNTTRQDLNILPGQSYKITVEYNPARNVLFPPPSFASIWIGCAEKYWNDGRRPTKNFFLTTTKSMTIDVSLSGNTVILNGY